MREDVAAACLVAGDRDGAQRHAFQIGEVVDHRHRFGAVAFGQVEIDGERRGIRDRVILLDALPVGVGVTRVRVRHLDFDVFIARGGSHDRAAQIQRAVQHHAVGIHEEHRRGMDVGVGERRRSHALFLGGAFVKGDDAGAGVHVARRAACHDFEFDGADARGLTGMAAVAFGGQHGHAVHCAAILNAEIAAGKHGLFREGAAAVNVDVRVVGGAGGIGHGGEAGGVSARTDVRRDALDLRVQHLGAVFDREVTVAAQIGAEERGSVQERHRHARGGVRAGVDRIEVLVAELPAEAAQHAVLRAERAAAPAGGPRAVQFGLRVFLVGVLHDDDF